MPQVGFKINGRGYDVFCDAGQEERILDLADYIDSRVRDIAAAGAASAESHLLVLASLVLADEVFELRQQIDEIRQQGALSGGVSEDEDLAVRAIEHLAGKIEHIAARIQSAEAA